ncbi:probable serine/threonine-protein kinase Kcc4p [Diutina catenulata]
MTEENVDKVVQSVTNATKRLSQISTSTTNSNKKRKSQNRIGPWKLGRTLGRGSTGRVRLAKNVHTGQLAAVKIVPKANFKKLENPKYKRSNDRLPYGIEREIIIMKLISHTNIMGLFDVWENKNDLFLILEYVEGGELFDYLIKRGRLREQEAVTYFSQIVRGISYLHQFNICHRDLKPENLLLDHHNNIKIADFGMAALEVQEKLLETSCGSPHYASPEIVAGKNYHGAPSDVWSCGIILFALLTGHLPFDDENIRELLMKVKSGRFVMPSYLSSEAQNLISQMLVVDPAKRITTDEIFEHPLLQKYIRDRSIRAKSVNLAQMNMKPIESAAHVDREILKNLSVLFHNCDENTIVTRLMSPGSCPEKMFYYLLMKYRQDNGRSESPKPAPKSPKIPRSASVVKTTITDQLTGETTTSIKVLPPRKPTGAVNSPKKLHVAATPAKRRIVHKNHVISRPPSSTSVRSGIARMTAPQSPPPVPTSMLAPRSPVTPVPKKQPEPRRTMAPVNKPPPVKSAKPPSTASVFAPSLARRVSQGSNKENICPRSSSVESVRAEAQQSQRSLLAQKQREAQRQLRASMDSGPSLDPRKASSESSSGHSVLKQLGINVAPPRTFSASLKKSGSRNLASYLDLNAELGPDASITDYNTSEDKRRSRHSATYRTLMGGAPSTTSLLSRSSRLPNLPNPRFSRFSVGPLVEEAVGLGIDADDEPTSDSGSDFDAKKTVESSTSLSLHDATAHTVDGVAEVARVSPTSAKRTSVAPRISGYESYFLPPESPERVATPSEMLDSSSPQPESPPVALVDPSPQLPEPTIGGDDRIFSMRIPRPAPEPEPEVQRKGSLFRKLSLKPKRPAPSPPPEPAQAPRKSWFRRLVASLTPETPAFDERSISVVNSSLTAAELMKVIKKHLQLKAIEGSISSIELDEEFGLINGEIPSKYASGRRLRFKIEIIDLVDTSSLHLHKLKGNNRGFQNLTNVVTFVIHNEEATRRTRY